MTEVDALLLVDLQRAFTRGPHAVPDPDRLLATVGTLLSAARSSGADVMSEMCVAATARGAFARGHHVTLVTGGHATYDVPPGPGGSPGVPASLAARAAEWSLGDEIEVVGHAGEVQFVRR